jgi:hypothetical protein
MGMAQEICRSACDTVRLGNIGADSDGFGFGYILQPYFPGRQLSWKNPTRLSHQLSEQTTAFMQGPKWVGLLVRLVLLGLFQIAWRVSNQLPELARQMSLVGQSGM